MDPTRLVLIVNPLVFFFFFGGGLESGDSLPEEEYSKGWYRVKAGRCAGKANVVPSKSSNTKSNWEKRAGSASTRSIVILHSFCLSKAE